MGIEYRAVIVVGVPYEDLLPHVEGLDDLIDEGTIDAYSPYFDADRDDWVVGFLACQSGDYTWKMLTEADIADGVSTARKKWDAIFPNIMPSIFLMPYGW